MTILRDWIESRGMTQRDLAEKVGVSHVMLNYLLRGKNTDIRISLLRRIHAATSIPYGSLVDDLLGTKEAARKGAAPDVNRAPPITVPTDLQGLDDDLSINFEG